MASKTSTSSIEQPPYISLDEALAVASQIQEQGGGSLAFESLSPVLKNSLKSSSFARKVSALRNFGLVESTKDRVTLTRLGQAYAAPTDGAERSLAVLQAMQSIDLVRKVHERYAGGVLPNQELLRNLLLREFQVPPEIASGWASFILESFRAAELTSNVGGKTVLRARPGEGNPTSQPSAPPLIPGSPNEIPAVRLDRPAATPDEGTIQLTFPMEGGRQAVILLPKEASEHDFEDMIDLLGVMKKRAARAAGIA